MESAEQERREGGSEEERDEGKLPAEAQSPVASDRMKAIKGDPGFNEGQGPLEPAADVDRPVATSAPPPQVQSGVPLPEDRAAGVEAGEPGPKPHGSTAEAAREAGQPPETEGEEPAGGEEQVGGDAPGQAHGQPEGGGGADHL